MIAGCAPDLAFHMMFEQWKRKIADFFSSIAQTSCEKRFILDIQASWLPFCNKVFACIVPLEGVLVVGSLNYCLSTHERYN
jgi:hypothetical protein